MNLSYEQRQRRGLCASASVLPQLVSFAHRLPPFYPPFSAVRTHSATVVGPEMGTRGYGATNGCEEKLRERFSVSFDLFFRFTAQLAL